MLDAPDHGWNSRFLNVMSWFDSSRSHHVFARGRDRALRKLERWFESTRRHRQHRDLDERIRISIRPLTTAGAVAGFSHRYVGFDSRRGYGTPRAHGIIVDFWKRSTW